MHTSSTVALGITLCLWPSPVYYGSGYIPSKDFWRLGAIFGLIYFVTFLVVSIFWVV